MNRAATLGQLRAQFPPRFQNDVLSASYSSDLEWMIERYQPSLWLHGLRTGVKSS